MADMKTVKVSGSITTFLGETIPELKFETTYDAYTNYADVNSDEKLSEKEMLAVVNEARKTAARAKRIAEVLKENGYEKPDKNLQSVILAETIKNTEKIQGLDANTKEMMLMSLKASLEAALAAEKAAKVAA